MRIWVTHPVLLRIVYIISTLIQHFIIVIDITIDILLHIQLQNKPNSGIIQNKMSMLSASPPSRVSSNCVYYQQYYSTFEYPNQYLNHFQASKIIRQVAKYKMNCFTFVVPNTFWYGMDLTGKLHQILFYSGFPRYLIDFHVYTKIIII